MNKPITLSGICWIQDLYDAAVAIQEDLRNRGNISSWAREQLTRALDTIEEWSKKIPPETAREIYELAKEVHEGDDVIVDEDGLICHNDADGYWVQGGLFVSDEDLKESRCQPKSA